MATILDILLLGPNVMFYTHKPSLSISLSISENRIKIGPVVLRLLFSDIPTNIRFYNIDRQFDCDFLSSFI